MAEVPQKPDTDNAIPSSLMESTLGGEEFYNYDATLEIRFLISSRHAGGIIGKNGSYINKIRDRAEVDFHVHRAMSESIPVYTDGSRATQNSPVRTGSCRGRVRNVVQALLLMADKITELSKNHVRRPSTNGTIFQYGDYQLTLLLEHKNCGVVIGKRGARINCNRQRSGAHIKISTHTLENSSEKTVDVQGSRDNIENALETLIVQIANDPKPSSTQRKYLDDSVPNKQRSAFFVQGRSGHGHHSSMLQFYPHLLTPATSSYHSPASTASYVIPPTHHYPANVNQHRVNVAGSQTSLDVPTPLNNLDTRMYNLVSSNPVGADALNEGEVPQGMALKGKGTQEIGLGALHNHSRSSNDGAFEDHADLPFRAHRI
jgi:predicted RNA-binding protein YlqC (UPF0109 family)